MAKVKPHVAERIKLLTPRFGQPASPIAGSRYVRWYCTGCGEPLRVASRPWPPPCKDCEVCGGRRLENLGRRSTGPRDDASPGQANAIRAMEGG